MVLLQRVILLPLIAQLILQTEGQGSQLHNLVDEYVDAYHSLISNRTPYERLRTLTHDSENLLELSKTLGTMLVNASLGYVETDSDNYTRVYYHGSGFSAQFGKLYEFFNPKLDRYTDRYRKWYRYVDLKTDSAYRHKCSSGPPCFSDAQDKLDIFPSMLVRLLKKLGAYFKQVQSYYTKTGNTYPTDFYYSLGLVASENHTGGVRAYGLAEKCDLFSVPSFWYCEDGMECSVQIINDIMGQGCEQANNATLEAGSIRRTYEDAAEQSKLSGGLSNKCFHNFLIRYSNYSADIYESFVDALGRYLLLELNMFGFCSPIAEQNEQIVNVTDRRQRMIEATQGIANNLLHGKQVLEGEGAGKSKSWTQLAHDVAHSAVDDLTNGKDLSYPSPDDGVETYKKIGQSLQSFPFNTETFLIDTVVYQPAFDEEDHCVLKSTNDTVEGRYRNANYVVSRCGRYQVEDGWRCGRVEDRIRYMSSQVNDTIVRLFTDSTKKNLCERIEDVERDQQHKFLGEDGFGTVVVVKCARKFVWFELAWKHFNAAWSSSEDQIFVNEGTYSSACALIVFIP